MNYRDRWLDRKQQRRIVPPTAQQRIGGQITDQYQAALEIDLLRLKQISSHERRAILKRDELLPRYRDYLQQVMQSGQGGQNNVLVQNLIWSLDAEEFVWAFELADYAIQHKMQTPENFQRDIRNLVAGQLADWCLQRLKLGQSPEPWASKIFTLAQEQEWDLVDKIRAILLRVQATLNETRDPGLALRQAEQAYQLDSNVGVSSLIKKLQKVSEE